jgi:membrane associated rhomboid family serine protease
MFFFPYSTDAPVYHWPFATVFLIAVNVVVFVVEMTAPEQIEPFLLIFGSGLNPTQWITALFLHCDIWHLLGNMLFLWSFGLVVEGKLGWWKCLAAYLGIGAAESAITQLLMLNSQGTALGASGAISGFMAISLVWAPENNIQCIFVYAIRTVTFEVKMTWFVGCYVLLQLVNAAFQGATMSSEIMHLLGAAVGFPLAIVLVKYNLVDCEHWDMFSVWAGRHTMTPDERAQADASDPARIEQLAKEKQRRCEMAAEQIRQIIRDGQVLLALKAHQRMSREFPDWTLSQADLFSLVQALHAEKLWTESLAPMNEYLDRYPEKSQLVRLKLAQILALELKRPAQALKVMAKIDPSALDARQREFFGRLADKAQRLHKENPYEVADA